MAIMKRESKAAEILKLADEKIEYLCIIFIIPKSQGFRHNITKTAF